MLGHPHPPRAAAPTRLALLPSALPSALLALVLVLVLGSAPALADPADEPEAPATAYQAAGAEIEGGSSIAQAPTVAPGLHRDSFAEGGADVSGDGTAKYYRIAVGEGERVHAAAVIAAPPYGSGVPEDYQDLSVGLAFVTAGGDDCNDSSTGTYGETHTADGPITTVRVSGPMGPEDCAGTELFLKVTRMGTRLADQPLPIEVQIAIEPAGTAGGDPSVDEEIADSGASPVAPAQSEPIELGRSFSGALPVEPGSYVIELVPGEVGFVSVPVGEGQRLRWRTEIVSEVGEEAGQLVVLARNPVRDQVAVGGGTSPCPSAGPSRVGDDGPGRRRQPLLGEGIHPQRLAARHPHRDGAAPAAARGCRCGRGGPGAADPHPRGGGRGGRGRLRGAGAGRPAERLLRRAQRPRVPR
ncbi:hypothetical protein IOE58_07865 [Brachybacterium sp. Marseille-Q2903]|uniref:Uncharacterized protein n=1 Tax=Brachybacterium epidermidis TaxID=2781983 RepID=A0ABR9W0Z2_9MICO|nr:hypothetical protein [Brachybacterium epidermidis]MBE9404106.1 hypothetical protein [Brachybacterium epidermidis]